MAEAKTVYCYSENDGTLIQKFDSGLSATKILGISPSKLYPHIQFEHALNGLIFSYVKYERYNKTADVIEPQDLFDSRNRLSSAKINALSNFQKSLIYSKNPNLISNSIPEHLYWTTHSLIEYPNKCLTCNKPVKVFESYSKGYVFKFCSLSCIQNNKNVQAKKKSAIKEKYGVDSIWKVPSIVKKRQDTCIDRYGVDNVMHFALNNIKTQYGVEHVSQIDGFLDRRLATVKIKTVEKLISTVGEKLIFDPDTYESHEEKITFTCRTCSTVFSSYPSINTICPTCNKKSTRSALEELIKTNITFGEIAHGKILYTINKEKYYFPDIFWPSGKLIVEADGNYWHSQLRSEKDGGDKLKSFHKKKDYADLGLRSLFFFEDELVNKSNIVLGIIKAKLGLFERTIAARKCIFKEISTKEANTFYDAYHLQGSCRSKISFGLFFNKQLVGAISLGKPRYNKHAEWELIRLCFYPLTNIIGGSSKLLKNAIKILQIKSLISYSDNRISDGAVYERLGFKLLATGQPSYFYMYRSDYMVRYHRSKFQKQSLIICEDDKKITEWELAQRAGLDRIWDCGSKTWLLSI